MAVRSESLSVARFNMHGFNNSWLYLQDLCKVFDLIFIQEHWLSTSQLHYFNDIDGDFVAYAESGMNDLHCLVQGRHYGGVAVLIRKSLRNSYFCQS